MRGMYRYQPTPEGAGWFCIGGKHSGYTALWLYGGQELWALVAVWFRDVGEYMAGTEWRSVRLCANNELDMGSGC